MSNPGAYPLDPDSDVGQFRLGAGDTNSIPLDPPVADQQDYTLWSDAEIEGYLARFPDSLNRAIGTAYWALAARAALESVDVIDYDLKANLTKRSADLRAIAQGYFDQAANEDLGSDDAFIITPTGTQDCWPPELSEWPVCGCGRWPCVCGGW